MEVRFFSVTPPDDLWNHLQTVPEGPYHCFNILRANHIFPQLQPIVVRINEGEISIVIRGHRLNEEFSRNHDKLVRLLETMTTPMLNEFGVEKLALGVLACECLTGEIRIEVPVTITLKAGFQLPANYNTLNAAIYLMMADGTYTASIKMTLLAQVRLLQGEALPSVSIITVDVASEAWLVEMGLAFFGTKVCDMARDKANETIADLLLHHSPLQVLNDNFPLVGQLASLSVQVTTNGVELCAHKKAR